MAWLYLVLAGIFEMAGVAMINKFNQDRDWKAMGLLLLTFGGSFLLLSLAMLTLPMGTAYAVWTGIGASGGAIVGMLVYNEPKSGLRILFIAMVLGAAVGLKLVA